MKVQTWELDLDNSIAHLDDDCPLFAAADPTLTSNGEPVEGFTFCPYCYCFPDGDPRLKPLP